MPATKTEPKSQTVIFASRTSAHRVVLVPTTFEKVGLREQKVEEKVAQFRDHRFIANEEAAKKLGVTHEELVDAMLNHPDLAEGGYQVVPNDVAAPDPAKDLETVLMLAAQQDVESLERVLREEREGWGRTVVIEQVENALMLLRDGQGQNAAVEGAESA